MRKTNGMLKAFISFWSWMAITLSAFFLFALAAVSKTVPRPAIIVFALVILALSIAAPVINPGIFAKRHTTAGGRERKAKDRMHSPPARDFRAVKNRIER